MRAPRGIAAAYALSGACALVYQVVWTHAFTERFGASGTTFLVVLCAFIGGLAARLSREPAVRAALAAWGLDSPGAILATILRTDDSLRQTWPRGPFVRDGFASLDALQISSPVQSNFREGTWLSWKPRLTYDVPAVVGTLRREAPAEAEDVERRLSGPSGLPRTVPPEYLRSRR